MSAAITNLNTCRRLIHGNSIPSLNTCYLYPILKRERPLNPGTTLYPILIHGVHTPPPREGSSLYYTFVVKYYLL